MRSHCHLSCSVYGGFWCIDVVRYMGSPADAHSYIVLDAYKLAEPQQVFLERTPQSSAGVRALRNAGASMLFLPAEIPGACHWNLIPIDSDTVISVHDVLAHAQVDFKTVRCIRQCVVLFCLGSGVNF